MLTSSSLVFEKMRLHTYDPVFMQLNGVKFTVSQNLIHWSAVPPPVASRPLCKGDQLMALTAAWCSENLAKGIVLVGDQMKSWLSLPPEAS